MELKFKRTLSRNYGNFYRMAIPPGIVEAFGTRKVLMVLMGDHIEIWPDNSGYNCSN